MSLLEEIQAAAVDSKSDLGTVLRKCKLLASRLGSQPLENWLLWESSGYPEGVDVPDYRIWPLQLRGTFSGYGAITRNVPIPTVLIPEKVRKSYQEYKCKQSIASIESTLAKTKSGKGTLKLGPGDLAVLLGDGVYESQSCIEAWAEIGEGNLFEVLNAVRNRILDFTLAVWKEAPTAGELDGQASGKIQAAQVTQIFQTTVYGPATVLGTAQNSSITLNVVANNFESLQLALTERGVSSGDIQELRAALAQDSRPTATDKFGPKVSSWMGTMLRKAAEGAWNTTLEVGSKVLVEAITKYYGVS